mmetsp:Transcript_24152/g.69226  ORF Transcript_24152/g.69226 Transcript_24152/m.69226 type:complete len:296 (+) Transcript_24152:230-1117(+)
MATTRSLHSRECLDISSAALSCASSASRCTAAILASTSATCGLCSSSSRSFSSVAVRFSRSAYFSAACWRSSWSFLFWLEDSTRTSSSRFFSVSEASARSCSLTFSSSSRCTTSSTLPLICSWPWSCSLCFEISLTLASRASRCLRTASLSPLLSVSKRSSRACSASPVCRIFSSLSALFAFSSSCAFTACASLSRCSICAFSCAMASSCCFSALTLATMDSSLAFSSLVLETRPSRRSRSTESAAFSALAASRSASAFFRQVTRFSRCRFVSSRTRSVLAFEASSFCSCSPCWS